MSHLSNNPIAFIDSGIGGLSLLSECITAYPAHYIYIADNKYMPYGNKSIEFLLERKQILISFVQSHNSSSVVYACNTLCTLDQQLNVTTLKQISIIDQLIDKALQQTKTNRIGIIGTQQTIESNHFPDKIKQKNNEIHVIQQACPELAPAIEQQLPNNKLTELVHGYLTDLVPYNIDTLILGCTHYTLIKNIFTKIVPNIKLIYNDARTVKDIYIPAIIAPSICIFTTGNKHQIEKAVAYYLPRIMPFVENIISIEI